MQSSLGLFTCECVFLIFPRYSCILTKWVDTWQILFPCSFMELLTQYEAVSFGDALFAHYILLPLQQRFDLGIRKGLWGEHAAVLRSLSLPISQVILIISKGKLLGSFFFTVLHLLRPTREVLSRRAHARSSKKRPVCLLPPASQKSPIVPHFT